MNLAGNVNGFHFLCAASHLSCTGNGRSVDGALVVDMARRVR